MEDSPTPTLQHSSTPKLQITRTIWVLSFVSLFADVASEMLYPVMPLYLKEVGFSLIYIGVLEGMAEAVSGYSKGYFGRMSDRTGQRMPFVAGGYFLGAISKPMMAMFVQPLWILFARTTDRIGKGLRSAARDAILAEEAVPGQKGRVFGFHRAWDTLGACIGPIIALCLMKYGGWGFREMFYWAFLPGMLAVLLTFLVRPKKHENGVAVAKPKQAIPKKSFISYWKTSTTEYRHLIRGLLFFALFNSSDAFLLLKARAVTGDDVTTIGIYVFYNLIYAIGSYPLGALADKHSPRKVFMGGLLLFAGVYAGMAFCTETWQVFALFMLYGVYAAATEGVAKSWLAGLCKKEELATGLGFYNAFQSWFAFAASILTAVLWTALDASLPFVVSAVAAVTVVVYFARPNTAIQLKNKP